MNSADVILSQAEEIAELRTILKGIEEENKKRNAEIAFFKEKSDSLRDLLSEVAYDRKLAITTIKQNGLSFTTSLSADEAQRADTEAARVIEIETWDGGNNEKA